MSRSRSKPERTPVTSGVCWVTKGDGTSLVVVWILIFTLKFYRTGGVLSAVLMWLRRKPRQVHPWLKFFASFAFFRGQRNPRHQRFNACFI